MRLYVSGLMSNGNKVRVKFVTDETTEKNGFNFTWRAVNRKIGKNLSPSKCCCCPSSFKSLNLSPEKYRDILFWGGVF